MNIDVMRCFYTITNIGTIRIGYREAFYNSFINIYPQYGEIISTQRLMDQKRTIVVNKRLTDIEFDNIKKQIAEELNSHVYNNINTQDDHNNNTDNNQSNPSQNNMPQATDPEIIINNISESSETIINSIKANIIKFTGTDPTCRKPIPKLQFNKTTNSLLETVNEQM